MVQFTDTAVPVKLAATRGRMGFPVLVSCRIAMTHFINEGVPPCSHCETSGTVVFNGRLEMLMNASTVNCAPPTLVKAAAVPDRQLAPFSVTARELLCPVCGRPLVKKYCPRPPGAKAVDTGLLTGVNPSAFPLESRPRLPAFSNRQ